MINEYKYDGNIIAWYMEYLKGRKTRVKYNNWVTEWRKQLENLLQGQTDSTILFDLMLNYIDLTDVDKIIKDIKMEVEETNYNIGKKYEMERFEKDMERINNKNKNNNKMNLDIDDISVKTGKNKIIDN